LLDQAANDRRTVCGQAVALLAAGRRQPGQDRAQGVDAAAFIQQENEQRRRVQP
jgi:hypothetical protein